MGDTGTKQNNAQAKRSAHLKKFLKILPGLSLLPPGVVGVDGVAGVKAAELGVGVGEIELSFAFVWLK